MRIVKRAGLLFILLMIITVISQPVAAQTITSRWFPETRHSVKGEFFKFYFSVKDPLMYFGYPITDEFRDSTGRLTQYFQRARFDLVISEKGTTVSLANLGAFLYEDIGAAYNIEQTGPTCRLFPNTGKSVCYGFLQFYDANQGQQYFGDPITNLEYRDGHVVQYFSKVRMEWQTNLPEGHKVTLSFLGRFAFDKYVGITSILWDNDPNAIPVQAPVTGIIARAFVHDALLGVGKQEIIYLIVQDQDMKPVKGAQASIIVKSPDGIKSEIPLDLDTTTSDGILKITLPVLSIAPRQVVTVDIKVDFQSLTTNTITSFRIWY